MEDGKHSKGPWRVDCEGDELVVVGPRAKHNRHGESGVWEVCRIDNAHFWDVAGVEEADRANARLIAAAPDLLTVAKAFVAKLDPAILVERDLPHSDLADELRAAIAAISRASR